MKKKIIIIAFVAALLYLLYKRGMFDSLLNKDGSSGDGGSSILSGLTGVDKNDTNSIIAATSMTTDLKKICKGWVRNITNAIEKGETGWSKLKQMERAEELGVTYEQQIVLSAIWQMNVTDKQITEKQRNSFMDEVTEL